MLPSREKESFAKRLPAWSSVPFTAAGSGMPQCAVIGCPGQIGHTSFAALSQTVKTKIQMGSARLQ